MNRQVKIGIVDDHQMFIDGIRSLLRKEDNAVFVFEANTAEDALSILKTQVPDLLITDISMPGMSGTDLTKVVKGLYPDMKVLVLTMYNDPSIISEILNAEAEGYILKNTGKNELINAINKIMDGGTYYSKEVLAKIRELNRKNSALVQKEELSPREIEILQLVCDELTTAEIAEKLFLSTHTVDTHRKNILKKTGHKTIVGLIKYAFEHNLIKSAH